MKTALVTGAGRGLGLELARQLLDRGWRVFATARNPQGSDGLAELKKTAGTALVGVALDVADPASIATAAEQVSAATGHLDLLVNNAGINSRSVRSGGPNVRFGELEPEGILEMVRVNAIGPVLVTQALVDLLEAAEHGRVVSISSWLGSIAGKSSGGNYAYCASKTTLNMLTRALAFDLVPRGVTSLVINPGWVQTDMGGSRAKLTPEESVKGILDTVLAASPEQAGAFLQWDGSSHPW